MDLDRKRNRKDRRYNEPLAKIFFCGSTSSPRTEKLNNFNLSPFTLSLSKGKLRTFARSSNGRGFTLMELIITLAILAIVALIAVPSFQRIAINSNLKTAARDVASDFAQLKARAISGDRDANNPGVIDIRMYRISLNVAGNSYQLQQCNNPGSPCGGWTTIQNKNLSAYANDIVFAADTAPPTNYTFQTRGTVNSGAIGLTNSRGSTATININFTGRTNVQFILQ